MKQKHNISCWLALPKQMLAKEKEGSLVRKPYASCYVSFRTAVKTKRKSSGKREGAREACHAEVIGSEPAKPQSINQQTVLRCSDAKGTR